MPLALIVTVMNSSKLIVLVSLELVIVMFEVIRSKHSTSSNDNDSTNSISLVWPCPAAAGPLSGGPTRSRCTPPRGGANLHPVSITRFSITRFSPGSGLLRNRFLHW